MTTKFKTDRRLRTALKIATAGVIGGTLLMPSVSPATHVIKAAQDVFVTNTPSNPVPTKAIGTTAVRVENNDENPVTVAGLVQTDVTNQPVVRSGAPYAKSLGLDINRGDASTYYEIPLPAGKVAVIENVAAEPWADSPEDQASSIEVGTAIGSDRPWARFSLDDGFVSERTFLMFTRNIPIRIERRGYKDGLATVRFSLSGYLVDDTGDGSTG